MVGLPDRVWYNLVVAKSKLMFAAYTIKEAGGGLFQACRVRETDGKLEPLPLPYGQPIERKWACKESSNALYRELCLGLKTGDQLHTGLSPDFAINVGKGRADK